jgi:hypothetical protein
MWGGSLSAIKGSCGLQGTAIGLICGANTKPAFCAATLALSLRAASGRAAARACATQSGAGEAWGRSGVMRLGSARPGPAPRHRDARPAPIKGAADGAPALRCGPARHLGFRIEGIGPRVSGPGGCVARAAGSGEGGPSWTVRIPGHQMVARRWPKRPDAVAARGQAATRAAVRPPPLRDQQ